MTIGIGFKCSDGIVLAAHTQLTAGDSHKIYECKMQPHYTDEANVTFAFAGDRVLWKSFNDKFDDALGLVPRPLTVHKIKNVIEGLLRHFEVLDTNPTELCLLCAIAIPDDGYALCKTEGHALHEVHQYDYVGSGDSLLLRFLGPLLTAPPPVAPVDQAGYIVRQAVMIAAYLVLKAITFVPGCGGETTVWVCDLMALWK